MHTLPLPHPLPPPPPHHTTQAPLPSATMSTPPTTQLQLLHSTVADILSAMRAQLVMGTGTLRVSPVSDIRLATPLPSLITPLNGSTDMVGLRMTTECMVQRCEDTLQQSPGPSRGAPVCLQTPQGAAAYLQEALVALLPSLLPRANVTVCVWGGWGGVCWSAGLCGCVLGCFRVGGMAKQYPSCAFTFVMRGKQHHFLTLLHACMHNNPTILTITSHRYQQSPHWVYVQRVQWSRQVTGMKQTPPRGCHGIWIYWMHLQLSLHNPVVVVGAVGVVVQQHRMEHHHLHHPLHHLHCWMVSGHQMH